MSSLGQLLIQGIRSFSPNDIEEIKFQTPLTLIVGANGSGKTTIIECLRYATTGDMPPISKGSGFITDPQFYNVTTVNAMVKLHFKNLTDDLVITRNSSLTLDAVTNKLNFKTNTKTLQTKDMVTKETIIHEPSKTAAIEDILARYIGVSKPILDYVIFTHQEDSLWPLADSNTLKKRFDEIFEVSRFTKELQHLNQAKKNVRLNIKIKESDVVNAKNNLKKAQIIDLRIEKLKSKLEFYESEKRQFEIKLKDIAQAQQELMNVNESHNFTLNEYDKLKDRKLNLITQLQKMTNLCPRILLNESEYDLQVITTNLEKEANILRYNLIDGEKENVLDQSKSELENLLYRLNEANMEKGFYLQAEQKYNDYQMEIPKIFNELKLKFNICNISSIQEANIVIHRKKDELEHLKTNFTTKTSNYESHINQLKNDIQVYESKSTHTGLTIDNLSDEITVLEKKVKHLNDHEVMKHGKNLETLNSSKNELLEQLKIKCSLDEINKLNQEVKNDSETLSFVENELKSIRNQILTVKVSSKLSNLYSFKRKEISSFFAKLIIQLREIYSLALKENIIVKGNSKKIEENWSNFLNEIDNNDSYERKYNVFMDTVFQAYFLFFDDLNILKENFYKKLNDCNENINDFKHKKEVIVDKIKTITKNRNNFTYEISVLSNQIFKVMNKAIYINDDSLAQDNYSYPSNLQNDFDKALKIAEENLNEATEALTYHNSIIKVYKSSKQNMLRKKCCDVCETSFENDKEKLDAVVQYLDNKINTDIEAIKKTQDLCKIKYESYKGIETAVNKFVKLKNDVLNMDSDIYKYEKQLETINELNLTCDTERVDLLKTIDAIDIIAAKALVLKNELENMKTYFIEIIDIEISFKNQNIDDSSTLLDINLLADLQNKKENEKQKISLSINTNSTKIHEINNLKVCIENEIQKLDYNIITLDNLLQEIKELDNQLIKRNKKLVLEQENNIRYQKSIDLKKNQLKDVENLYHGYNLDMKSKIEFASDNLQLIKNYISSIEDYYMPEIKKYEESYAGKFKNVINEINGIENEIKEKNVQIDNQRSAINKSKDKINKIKDQLEEIRQCLEHHELKNDLSVTINKLSQINYEEVIAYKKQYVVTLQQLSSAFTDISSEISLKKGEMNQIEQQINTDQNTLNTDYKNAQENYHELNCNSKTLLNIEHDLEVATKVIETSIMQFHKTKMEEINVLLDELWRTTYRGSDIATIKIVTEKVTKSQGVESYNYKVVMYKDSLEIDMRGRCSAGQKVMACILIRLALAETFGVLCGVITLDEPTTNLDEENSEGLAESLHRIIESRRFQKNFQIVIITHDENFLKFMNAQDFADGFWKVSKDNNLASKIEWIDINKLM
ncbi:hypothetical protein QEN19_002897 [Hanseniaspora menglaensis]